MGSEKDIDWVYGFGKGYRLGLWVWKRVQIRFMGSEKDRDWVYGFGEGYGLRSMGSLLWRSSDI